MSDGLVEQDGELKKLAGFRKPEYSEGIPQLLFYSLKASFSMNSDKLISLGNQKSV